MYLSKNSRYVLLRAKCMSHSFCFLDCLKGNQKNFCVKSPKDDPTKPPLRINIPKDSEEKHEEPSLGVRDSAKIHKKDVTQPRSKSLLSKPTHKHPLAKPYEDDYVNLPRSESDVQIKNYRSESDKTDSKIQQFSGLEESQQKQQTLDKTGLKNKESVVRVPISETPSKSTIQENVSTKNKEIVLTKKENVDSAKIEMQSDSKQMPDEKNNEQKALYIIIDVPDSQSLEDSKNDDSLISESNVGPPSKLDLSKTNTKDVFTSKIPKLNSDSLNNILKGKSKKHLKNSQKAAKSKSEPKIKFQVHEIDEAATYVFQLRFKKDLHGKSFAVGCVPEKELKTRTENLPEDEGQVRSLSSIPNSNKAYKGLGPEVTTIDDPVEYVDYKVADSELQNKESSDYYQKTFKIMKSQSNFSNRVSKNKDESKKHESKFEGLESPSKTTKKLSKNSTYSQPAQPQQQELQQLQQQELQQPQQQELQQPQHQQEPALQIQEPQQQLETAGAELEPRKNVSEAGRTDRKVENILNEDVYVSEYYTQTKSVQPSEEPKTPEQNQYQAQAQDSTNYAQQYYSEYSEQQHPAPNTSQQEPYDPDAKEYYYYHVNRHENKSAADNQIPEMDHPSDSALKPVKNIIDYHKPYSKKKKSEKGGKSGSKGGNNMKASSATDSSYKGNSQREPVDFHTSANVVKISSESSSYPMKFCAAYPPILNEIMIHRNKGFGGRRRNGFFNSEKKAFQRKDFDKKKDNMDDLSENSILFPKGDDSSFDCSSLFVCKKTEMLSVLGPDDNSPKISDNMVNMANESLTESKSEPSLDSLSTMKKVKEIVDFDLNNAVKLFEGRDRETNIEVTSVIVSKGNTWEVDEEVLKRCIDSQKNVILRDTNTGSLNEKEIKENNGKSEKIDKNIVVPKLLPGRKENEAAVKLKSSSPNSVVTYNENSRTFHVDVSNLEKAMRTSSENFEKDYLASVTPEKRDILMADRHTISCISQTDLSKETVLEMKGGDSILVFDELTQTWKVDFTILEKRQEQIRQEEELTKRSELILETIEKLEKENISSVPKPDSREKKIFDYTSEEWKAYKPEESSVKSDKKSTTRKLPFKEYDAEEIRKKNSDLYENLFVVNKKERKPNKEGKEAPGLNTSTTKKETAGQNTIMAKDADSGKISDIPSSSTIITPKESDKPSQKKEEENAKSPKKEDDNYWENFLKTNILPFDRPEQPRPIQPPKPPPLPTPPSSIIEKSPDIAKIKVPPPNQPQKIDEPKVPFLSGWNKKIDPGNNVSVPPVSKDPKIDIPKSKVPPAKPEPISPATAIKIEIPKSPLQAPGVPKKDPLNVPKKESPAVKSPPAGISKESPPTSTKNPENSVPPVNTPSSNVPPAKTPPSSEKKRVKPSIGGRKIPSIIPNFILKIPPLEKNTQTPPKTDKKPETEKPQKPSIPIDIQKMNLPIPTKPESVKSPPPTPSQIPPDSKQTNVPQSPAKPPVTKIPSVEGPQTAPTPAKPNDPSPPSTPPTANFPAKGPSTPTKDQPPSPPQSRIDPKEKSPPTIGAPQGGKPGIKASKDPEKSKNDLKTKSSSVVEKKDRAPSDHYISDNIVEMSRSSIKDGNSKAKPNKIETVKLNITSDKRVPSKITEINLNKKCEETVKEPAKKPKEPEKKNSSDKSLKKGELSPSDNKFYEKFEKYKTPFSDPEYEEKYTKINSDIESNPNLKKLDNWNKTLVLQDVVKPPDNIENWLKDETDKMATLLLKVLQEAAEGKPRKKALPLKGKSNDRTSSKGNPYDNIRKKQETNPESFLFKVRSVNIALDASKKSQNADASKTGNVKIERPNEKDIPVQSAKTVKPLKIVDAVKICSEKDAILTSSSTSKIDTQSKALFADSKPKLTELIDPNLTSCDLSQTKIVTDVTDDIPGPEILKKISSTWKLFPVLGCQLTIFSLIRVFQLVNLGSSLFSSVHPDKSRRNAFSKLFAKYGPIVNLQGPLSGNVILIYKPEHLSAVFEQDTVSSVRSIFDSLDQSRRDVDEKVFLTPILTDWSKPEWNTLKKVCSDPGMRGCEKFFEPVEIAADCLVNNIRRNRNGQNLSSDNFMDEIKRWSMEGLCSVLFTRSFGFLENRTNSVNWLLEPDKLYLAVEDATEYLSKCERGFQFWRLMTTPSLVGLGQAYRTLSTILAKQLYQAEVSLRNKNEQIKEVGLISPIDLTYIESVLLFDGLTPEEITYNLADTLIVGTNTMSSSLGFLLYRLAQNVKVQQRLFKEIKEILPEKSSRLDYQKLHSSRYLQACLKESMRLNTPFPLFFRLLQNDILLSNYVVPKGTYVVMDSRVSCMKEQVFEEPDKFIPERWLTEDKWMQSSHPFSSFPLCHGPRSDLAKRIVEMQLCSCVAKIVRNFEIEYHFGEVFGTEDIISFPDKPLKFNFIERND